MTKQQKITLSASRDIPFNKLMLSQSNVRHVKAGVSIEELAEHIARWTLLSSITVRPVLDDSGAEIGMYTIPADGRRLHALDEVPRNFGKPTFNEGLLCPRFVAAVSASCSGDKSDKEESAGGSRCYGDSGSRLG